MKNARYWLWLQRSVGCGARLSEITAYFGTAKELFEAGENAWLDSRLFGNDLIEINPKRIRMMKSVTLEYADRMISSCRENGIGILTPEDDEYPKGLMSLPNFPAVLFYRGDPSCLKSKSIFAVIGTRNPSDYGKMACKTIVEDLAANGSVIVSGGALGIDSAAHSTCVEAGAKTVLVSGTGIDSDYPKQNSELREAIASHGCIISEYAPGSGASHSSFPLRNRIVAALSMAIIVFEAGEKSGTLNTCGHAKKLGKPIFVLPGAIDSELYIGSNRLIDEGAVPLFSAEMVYRYFDMKLDSGREAPQGRTPFSGINTFTETPGLPAGVSRTERLAKAAQKRKSGSENTPAKEDEALVEEAFENEAEASAPAFDPGLLSPNAAVVFAAIKNGSVNLDSIVRESGLAAHLVMRALSELEMEGAVEKINSLEYKIK